jgi:hypothetical protein
MHRGIRRVQRQCGVRRNGDVKPYFRLAASPAATASLNISQLSKNLKACGLESETHPLARTSMYAKIAHRRDVKHHGIAIITY